MNSATKALPMQCLEGLHEAIPTLLASSDFFYNLEHSLQIIGDTFGLDQLFLAAPNPSAATPGALSGLILLERSDVVGWQEVLQRSILPEMVTLSGPSFRRIHQQQSCSGPAEMLFSTFAPELHLERSASFRLIPLFCQTSFKGVLCLSPVEDLDKQPDSWLLSLDLYTRTLANWLERYEVFRAVRHERDQLRDVINLGEIPAVKEAQLTPNWEYSITDAQLLNRKITTTIPDHIFIIDLHDHSNLYSNRPNFLGYELSQIDNPFEFFQQLIHPDDLGPAFDDFFEHLMQAKDDDIIESEYRMLSKTGEVIWFNERVKVFKRDQDGQVRQYLNILQNITARKEAELARQESDTLFRSLYEKNPLGVVIGDPKGNILHCNERFAEMLNYTEEELRGCNFENITHPEDFRAELARIQEEVRQQQPLMFLEKRYLDRNGRVIWANLNMTLLYHESGQLRLAIGMVEDITEKRKILLNMQKNEAFQKAILTTLPDLKFRISREGYYVDYYPSPNDEQDLLVPASEFLGKNLSEILPGYIADALLKNIESAIATGELREFEYVLPIRGRLQHYEIRISAINKEEVIAVSRNVSERNWAQILLKDKIRELDEKNRELKDYIDSNMQLENFAYIASHDLREPLRTMSTFAQLLQKRYDQQLDEAAQTYINFVVKGAKDMNNLIEDLLTYSRIETHENPRENIDLPALLDEVISGLKKTITENQAVIEISGLPGQIVANPYRLKQLFQNLIANAIKFRKSDLPPVVRIEGADLGKYWQFAVSDNGIGIDPEFYGKIFLLFKKLHSRQDFQGTGLGLAICKKVVEQMEGEIWVESETGVGSTFFFTLKKIEIIS